MKSITVVLASVAVSAVAAASGTTGRNPSAHVQFRMARSPAPFLGHASSRAPGTDTQLAGTTRIWTKTWGGSGNDSVHHVAADASGNVYATGEFVGTVDFDPDPAKADTHSSYSGSIDCFLSKFAPDGSFLWARTWGGAGRDVSNGLALDGLGNAYVSGPFQYIVDFNPSGGASRTSNAGSMNNIYLSKFAPDGTFEWVRTWGPSDAGGESYNIAIDASNNVYVAGDFAGSGCYFNNTTQPASDWHANHPSSRNPDVFLYFDSFLSKYDSNGTFLWAKTWGGEGYDDGPGVAIDGLGNVYVAGMYASKTIDFDPAGGGATDHPAQDSGFTTDVFLSKFDSSGNFKWVRTWGGQGATDSGQAVAVDGANNVYVVGRFESTTCDFNPGGTPDIHSSHGAADAFVSKFDPSGAFQWARTWGGAGADAAGGLAADGANNLYVSGYFAGTAQFDAPLGTTIATSNGGGDVFVISLGPSGTFQGASTWGGSGDDWAYHATLVAPDKMYVVGSFQTTVDFDPGSGVDSHTSNGAADAFVSKFLFSVAAPPTVATVVPSGGTTAGGTTITLAGTGFTAGATVTVGGLAATGVAVASGTTLTAMTPAHAAGLVDVVVSTVGGVATAAGAYTYVERPTFTNDPLAAHITVVKGVHVTELRAAIASLRARYGLSAVTWTDATPLPGSTTVKAVHVTELRTALSGVYGAAGRTPPTYTDATLTARGTVVATTHIAELRAAIVAIW